MGFTPMPDPAPRLDSEGPRALAARAAPGSTLAENPADNPFLFKEAVLIVFKAGSGQFYPSQPEHQPLFQAAVIHFNP